MLSRIPFLTVVFVVTAGLPLLAGDEKVHDGKVVKAGNGKIILTFKGEAQKHTHDVAKDAKITLDDKKAMLEDLKQGFPVKVVWNDDFVVTKIEAKSKDK